MKAKKANIALHILLPIILGICFLYFYQGRIRKAAEIGLGKGTSSYTPFLNKFPIHIMNLEYPDSQKTGWINRGSKGIYLWQGNSQLHGINQYKAGQVNCIQYLYDSLKHFRKEVLGTSYPNGNMQEFLLSAIYFSNTYPLKGMVQPVFYDDMREDGIRSEMNIPDVRKSIYSDSSYYTGIESILKLKRSTTSSTGKSDDFKGIQETVQDKSERYLDGQLEKSWGLWASRPDLRGNLFNDVYFLRNTVLGIKANTVRKMIPGRYKDNYNSFLQMLRFCNDKHIPLIIYIPPLRNDVSPPYDIKSYKDFITSIQNDCKTNNVIFLDLEDLVPAQYWGVKEGTSIGSSSEIDFMHFQEAGHKLIADTIYKTIKSQWLHDL